MFHGSIVDLQKENESKKFRFFSLRFRVDVKKKLFVSDFVAALFLSAPVTMWKIGRYLSLSLTYTQDLVLSKLK